MEKKKNRNFFTLMKELMPYIRPHKVLFFFSIFFDLVAIAMNVTIPVITGMAIDCMIGIGKVDFTKLYEFLTTILVITCFSSLFDWLGTYYVEVMSFKTAQIMRNTIYAKLLTVPIKFIDNKPHGDIMNTMLVDVDNIMNGILSGFKAIVCGVFKIIIVAIIMLFSNWIIGLFVICFAPFSLILAIIITKKSKKMYRLQVEEQGRLTGYAEEMLLNMKIVKAFNNEKNTVEKFDVLNDELYVASEKSMFYSTTASPISRFVSGLTDGIVVVIGALLAFKGRVKVGRISSFLTLSDNFTSPFNDITNIFADLNVAIASAGRVFDLINQENETDDSDLPEMRKCNGEVKLTDVSFSYEKAFKLIENLNLDVKQGQRVAIVGPTGCGKSTIINLLMRFYDVNNGSIKVSGKDIRKVKRNSFRKFYGMVLQESWLYNASVKDNVAYGKQDATMDEIVEACKLANAHSFIEKLPDGYDTIISERGDNISAGQKQLLCIARIMLLKPPMIILDEATSNIDTRTEMKIQEALDKIMEGKTCFIVAHRLSTIENADCILVMNRGHIVEQGTHKELLEKQGFYYQLFNSQFGN